MLRELLGSPWGEPQPPIRSEIFGMQRFAQHGRSLGATHHIQTELARTAVFFPRLRDNIKVLRLAQRYIAEQAATGYDLSPAAEWLLDNFHLIEAQLKEVRDGLPKRYFRALPVLRDEPLAGLPRVYGVAWAFVAHSDGAFDEELLVHYLLAYQEARELTLGEMWALPTTLRVVLIENLRRLAERVATHKAAREVANLCCDDIAAYPLPTLVALHGLLQQRGVGQVFLAQLSQRLQGRRAGEAADVQHWLQQELPQPAVVLAQQIANQAADNLSVSNSIHALRAIGGADWPHIVARSSHLMTLMLRARSFSDDSTGTRDQVLHAIEAMARAAGRSEVDVAHALLALMHAPTCPLPTAAATTEPGTGFTTEHRIEPTVEARVEARVEPSSDDATEPSATQRAATAPPVDAANGVAAYWLHGAGRPQLVQALGLRQDRVGQWRRIVHSVALPVYLGTLALGSLGLLLLVLRAAGGWPANVPMLSLVLMSVVVLLMLLPASEAVVAVINRLISESARPVRLPRLAFTAGIPAEHRVLVAVPSMLTSSAAVQALVHRLHLHHLANREAQVQFVLLSDYADAASEHLPGDAPLLGEACAAVRDLNQRYPAPPGQPPRFILLHRARRYSQGEQAWIGWERKRGKLQLLVAAMAERVAMPPDQAAAPAGFIDLGELSHLAPATPYLVTLDSDTELPPGRLRELVSIAAHPQNRPVLDTRQTRVLQGWGILQPRVATPLPDQPTPFHWLFSGQCGIDPYSAASSEVYQDLFGEGSFSGKGLLHVQAVHAVLGQRLPDNQVLSHDLLEGSMARCAVATDVTVLEEAPFHADVAVSRLHRWTRGDWQLLPFLLQPRRYPLRAINRWKMWDNLRRSLVAPASLALLLLALAGPALGLSLSPGVMLALVLAAFTAGPLMGALAGLAPSRDDIAKRHFYRQAGADLARALSGGLWHLSQLLAHALMSVDAIARALWRMTVSRRQLLQWTTAAAAQAAAQSRLSDVLRAHWSEPLVALLLLAALWAGGTPHLPLALLLCGLWALAPLFTWWASRVQSMSVQAPLPLPERAALEGIARDSWRFFERCVGPEDKHLPPDNLQTDPYDMVAHRTSPTNIGMYLLSTACAQQFGWIGSQELLQRLEATLATLDTLERCHGHFLNWYDTRTGAALLPRYVSSVDSGNLSGHLLTVAQACRELAARCAPATGVSKAPSTPLSKSLSKSLSKTLSASPPARASSDPFTGPAADALDRALAASHQRLAPLLARFPQVLEQLAPAGLGGRAGAGRSGALAQLLVLTQQGAVGLRQAEPGGDGDVEQLLQRASEELMLLWPPAATAKGPSTHEALAWCLADHLATARSAWLDLVAQATTPLADTARRLHAVADRCERLAWAADFACLYNPRRRLMHLGLRVAEHELDMGLYDLLASESRLTSLLAIAKADVPVSHWAALGRPFHAVGSTAALRSWSGSMFEYLMPGLVLAEPRGSVLRDACDAAVIEQIHFGQQQRLPWGVSESAYAARDASLAYQYAPQGVPRLALRRTPPEDRVVAPYATAMASQWMPRRALVNLQRLAALGARQRYGFIEALDYSPARLSGDGVFTPVSTFMAHHQGMSIVALANVLHDGVAQRWCMANPHLQAVASLLHERAPREVPARVDVPSSLPQLALQALQNRTPGPLREVQPGVDAVPPTHVLGNGSYRVSLRANGAGTSRWRGLAIHRERDDLLRDALGSFFYLRLARGESPVSITQHPAPDKLADYTSTFHADRVCFDAAWPTVRAHTTVWVSPEDDIEFRQIDLYNSGEDDLDLELISAFEVTLADPRSDEAHPVFSNLFVSAEWRAAAQALVFERRPRQSSETGLCMAHFLVASDVPVHSLRVQTDRALWLGRNQGAGQFRAQFQEPPATAQVPGEPVVLDTGLDPVCAMSLQLRVKAQSQVRLTFATAATPHGPTLAAVIDKYRQPSHVQRASLMSATMMGIRLRSLKISVQNFAALQSLTTALMSTLTRHDVMRSADPSAVPAPALMDKRLLWRLGISGDRPLLLVTVATTQGLPLLRTLAQALRLWSWGGVTCDLVVVNEEMASYDMPLHREVGALRDQHAAEIQAEAATRPAGDAIGAAPAVTGLFLLRAEELSPGELSTLHGLARVHLQGDARPLSRHVQAWVAPHDVDIQARQDVFSAVLPVAVATGADITPSQGRFDAKSGAFEFEVGATMRPRRPWINVLANPDFGCHVSETGGGHTWAVNSRLNQITAWANDPLADPSSDWLLLQDPRTGALWSLTPSAHGHAHGHAQSPAQNNYRVQHGQGSTRITHRIPHADGEVVVTVTWCVDAKSAVKQVQVRLHNASARTLRWRLIGVVEWQLGATRSDRGGVSTGLFRQRLGGAAKLTALWATQQEQAAGFGGGTAYFGYAADSAHEEDWTCDRREFFDARGRAVVPDHFGQRAGAGLDPCAAVAIGVRVAAGASAEHVFLTGYAATADAARHAATEAASVSAAHRLQQAQQQWQDLLQATQVQTPDPLFDALVNRWLLYQAVSCRLWAKAGLYQAGGATGFRDQLQDTLALSWARPALLRNQILTCAGRQFVQGDVQHWWHAPGGAGVRTHFSDDLLWLPWACVHHVRTSGDPQLLDEMVPFLEGRAIPPGAEDAYDTPTVSVQVATVYEHAALTLDRSLAVGSHGLPLMGSGDWNDGMNRVGIEGRGESVWLAWFLCKLVADFAPLAQGRGDGIRAARWLAAAQGWRAALEEHAWDGQWYRRAFFDDGSPLGAAANAEGRIDLIAQAWSVLSQAAPLPRQQQALASMHEHLVDAQTGLVRLLDPPLQKASPSAGYIQAYPPGVRENGGQYSHGAVWALMAQAELLQGADPELPVSAETRDLPYRYFTLLSPAHRAQDPRWGAAYGIEPYVMAGDICSQPPHAGRGGWSWYTGAAAWMHRAAVESIFGLRLDAQELSFRPALPSHWPQAQMRLQRDGRSMHFTLHRGSDAAALAATAASGARLLRVAQTLDWPQLPAHSHFVIPLPGADGAERAERTEGAEGTVSAAESR